MTNLGKASANARALLIYCIGCLGILIHTSALGANFTVELDRTDIAAGEIFSVRVIMDKQSDFEQPQPEGSFPASFNILSGPNVQISTKMFNFAVSIQTVWSWEILATEAGQFTLPSFRLGSSTTEKLNVKVDKAKTMASGFNELLVTYEADKTTATIGEQIILTWKVKYSAAINAKGRIEPGKVPLSFENQLLEPNQGKSEVETIQGQPYKVKVFKQAVYATEAGEFNLEPVVFDGQYSNTNSRNFRFQPIQLASNPLKLTITPLNPPAGVKQTKIPVSDNLRISSQWMIPNQPIDIGEPITLEVHMSAPGQAATRLPTLKIKSTPQLKIYSDGEESRQDFSWTQGITGYKTQKFVIIPQKVGTATIPPSEVTWWNTKTKAFETKTIEGQTIEVSGGMPLNPASTKSLDPVEFNSKLDTEEKPAQTEAQPPPADADFWRNLALILLILLLFGIARLLKSKWFNDFLSARKSGGRNASPQPNSSTEPTKSPTQAAEQGKLNRRHIQLKIVPILELHPHDVPPREACQQVIKLLCDWVATENASTRPANISQLLYQIEPRDQWYQVLVQCQDFLYNPAAQGEWPKEAIRQALLDGLPQLVQSKGSNLTKPSGLAPFKPD